MNFPQPKAAAGVSKDTRMTSAKTALANTEALRSILPDYVSNEAREIAAEAMLDFNDEHYATEAIYALARWFDAVIAALRTLPSSDQCVAREAVAWEAIGKDLNQSANLTRIEGVADIWRKAGITVRPLYAVPQAAVAEEIDAEDMDDFIRAVLADNNPRSDEPFATVAKWIRKLRPRALTNPAPTEQSMPGELDPEHGGD